MNAIKILPLVLLAAACGAAELPQARVVEAESDIKAAETVGAEEYPKAALHLKLARDGLKDAKRLLDKGEDDKARLALERARADAELSLALTYQAEANAEAREALSKIDELSLK